MVQFKALVLVVAVIINLNSCKGSRNFNMKRSCNEIVFYNSHEQIFITNNNYIIINNDVGFELKVVDSDILERLKKIENPIAEFCVENKEYRAKGNNILCSKIPSDSEYFFTLDQIGKINFFKNDIVNFRKVKL